MNCNYSGFTISEINDYFLSNPDKEAVVFHDTCFDGSVRTIYNQFYKKVYNDAANTKEFKVNSQSLGQIGEN